MQWVCVRGWWMSGAGIARRGCCCVCCLHIVSLRALIHILSAEAVKDPFKMLRAWFTIRLSNFFILTFYLFILWLFIIFNFAYWHSYRKQQELNNKASGGHQEFVSVGQVEMILIGRWAIGQEEHCSFNLRLWQLVCTHFSSLTCTGLWPNVNVIKWLVHLCSASS